ncbi:hydrogenase [Acetobacter peroxydans]|jgi:hydrogenase-1 operon protein HyaE|uniref:Hydrogenase expression/formation protein n=1 Tax=Acetobacter peroxydans TaxID=104098 RepID=A0A4Y3TS15_9PROT|nr:hydrogenase [Acetobacter peroxydans]MCH4144191.1 hypothetical protein [Acetobacter peroxydans]MCI1395166.1 hypothetical protein [Acetobacter peroxydans]MCI1412287.1 hypothetical protein [Acetobacter peroxydans]MCI1439690.1 hypothetical protein [Acetobacter peroxydans]MCI1567587.1 hypothetical protein [Acetobacter peroxydans]
MPDILLTPPLQRLQTQFGMPVLDETAAAAPGVVLLFLPSHARVHLETPDIAAVLPDLAALCAARLNGTSAAVPVSGAIATAALEARLVRETGDLSLPALVLLNQGEVLGNIARMRDWGDYATRLATMLAPLTSQPESAS